MREHHAESPFVRLLRAAILLGALILIPGVAVCWNLLPKQHRETAIFAKTIPADEPLFEEPESFDDNGLSALPEPPVLQALNEPTLELNPIADTYPFPVASAASNPIRAMSWDAENETQTVPIPSALESPNTVPLPTPSTTPGHGIAPQRSFPMLEAELQALGVKYYRLEKWGNRGELFRFSCHVASTGQYSFLKLFQEIDSDEIRVMERVIADIKDWQGGSEQGAGNRN